MFYYLIYFVKYGTILGGGGGAEEETSELAEH